MHSLKHPAPDFLSHPPSTQRIRHASDPGSFLKPRLDQANYSFTIRVRLDDIMTPTELDTIEIDAILARQSAAWEAGDAIAFAADVQNGVLFTNIVGMFSIGRGPFVDQHDHILSTIYKGSKMVQDIVAITFIRPDLAIVDTLTRLVDAPHRPPGIELIDGAIRTRLEQVIVKDDAKWKVASFHNVAVHPAAVDGAVTLS